MDERIKEKGSHHKQRSTGGGRGTKKGERKDDWRRSQNHEKKWKLWMSNEKNRK